ncbi:MAG TPA: glycoside hydrolase family 2 protein, partial [Bacteroidia bacterium]|nr:glycoside hydrolase family 2 protein [Bacteroidia bacterium]
GSVDWFPATVPGTVHTDLLNNRQIIDPFQNDNAGKLQWIDSTDWDYSCEFNLTAELLNHQEGELVFYGLDTYAKVFLNDSLVLNADNMFRTWKVNCLQLLKPGKNTLKVRFESAVKKGAEAAAQLPYNIPGENRVFTRKAAYHYGWDFAPRFVTCGIWKPVELQFWNHFRLQEVKIILKELTEKRATLHMEVEVLANDTGFFNLKMINKATGQRLGKNDSLKRGLNIISYDYMIYSPKKWWCRGYGEPFLYTFYFEGNDFRGNIDRKEFSYGIRTIEVVQEKDSIGKSFYFKLNGIPVFVKGANVVPADVFVPSTRSGYLDSLIQDAGESNMNMLRVWGGGVYAADEFYSKCDRMGLMVWQDFMFACSMVPGDSAFVSSVRDEVRDNVRRLRNHPCIALWCGNNESDEGWKNWGWQKQYNYSTTDSMKIWNDYNALFSSLIPGVLQQEDAERYYWPSSPSIGWGHPESLQQGDSHYWGVWWGMEPFDHYKNKIGRFVSEYGFQSLPSLSTLQAIGVNDNWSIADPVLQTHQKNTRGFETISEYMKRDYPEPVTSSRYLYFSQLLQADALQAAIEAHRRARPVCMGTLYWQLNDCWPGISWSSRDYYGNWKASQYRVKDRYKTVIVSPVIEGDKLNTYVVSDSVTDIQGILVLRLFSFDGKEKWFHQENILLKAGSSALVHSIDTVFTKQKIDPANGYLLASIVSSGVTLDQQIFYFRKPKDLLLAKTKPEIKITENGKTLTLKSKMLLKNIYLRANGDDRFVMNYFDVLPGIDYNIPLPPGISGKNIRIQTESLNDRNSK